VTVHGKGAVETATTVELRMTALAENVALARLALTGVAAVAEMTPDEVADLKLAVSEVCTNAVLHAYPDGTGDEQILVRYTVAPDALTVEVADTGVGFDPDALPEPRPQGPDGRMGLAIVRAVTDDVAITSDASGTRIAFSKRRSA
jgi:serine/threonine-protein kinase RsbW